MRVRPLRAPVAGEHLIAVEPGLSLFVAEHWRRRLNLFTGRSLTGAALNSEQAYRAGMLALRGLSVSPGAVQGLEADIETVIQRIPLPPLPGFPGGTRPRFRIVRSDFLQIAGGYGIAASGEDVLVPRPLRVVLNAVKPHGTDEQLRKNAAGELATELGQLIAFARSEAAAGRTTALPPAGILVLEPVRFSTVGEFDPESQCEIDPESFPFEDQQLIDGCRLVLHLWPQPWPVPPRDPATQPDRWRNRLAYAIFEREQQLEPGAVLPWDGLGVPIALIGFDAEWNPAFADRAAVARAGGRPRRRAEWIRGGRNRFFAQARLEQLAEQLSEPGAKGVPAATLGTRFLYLPPAGLLPRDAWDFVARTSAFFPGTYRVDATPVPLEQLDAALEGAAMLARFELDVGDDVEILVPVPQVWFEPRLLEQEVIDAEFDQALERFRETRDEWLYRRRNVRIKSAALVEAVTGMRPEVPPLAEDPDALEPEPAGQQSAPPFRFAHLSAPRSGIHQHFFHGASSGFPVGVADTLFAYVYVDRENPPTQIMLQWNDGTWNHRAYWGASRIEWGGEGTVSRHRVSDEIPEPGAWVRLEIPAANVGLAGQINGIAFTLFDGRVAWGTAGILVADSAGGLRENAWFDGELPLGAVAKQDGGDTWEWLDGDLLAPFENAFETGDIPKASRVHRSLARSGAHQHFFTGATSTMAVKPGDRLYAWVLTASQSQPVEIMLQWNDGTSWNHRAYWGKNVIPWGADGSAERRAAGRLPAAGRWTRLEISADAVGLAGVAVRGVAFTLQDGGAVWGPTGRIAAGASAEIPWWEDDQLPAGAAINPVSGVNEAWEWRKAPTAGASPAAMPMNALWYDRMLDPISEDERTKLQELGVERFIPFLEARIDKADDVVNLGFARLNVNSFRLRQVTLGSTAASRLAVSPVYAQIARSETAVAATQQVTHLAALIKGLPLAELKERDLVPEGPVAEVRGGLGGLQPEVDPRDTEILRASRGVELEAAITPPPAVGLPETGITTAPPTLEAAPAGTLESATGLATLAFTTPEVSFGNIALATGGRAGLPFLAGARTFTSAQAFGASVSGSGFGAPAGMLLKERDLGARLAATGSYTAKMQTYYGATRTQVAKQFTAASFLPPVSLDRKAQERIEAQVALPGTVAVRSTTIAERIAAPAAAEARNHALAARYEILNALRKLEISLEGIELTGVTSAADTPVDGKLTNYGQPKRETKYQLRAIDDEVIKLLRTEIDPTTQDEPNFVVAAIDLSDHIIVLLRKVEGRIREYRLALEACRQALAELKAAVANADRRLQAIGTELAEARHDVAVALALKAEEQARLDAINARRAQIIAEQVKFLAYRRPRWTGTFAATPSRRIDPALIEAPVPACLAQDHEPPEELRAMIDLAREAPARWYTRIRPMLDRIARIEHLIATFEAAQARTRVKTFALPATRSTVLGNALTTVLTAQHQLLAQRKQVLLQLEPGRLAALNWKASRATAEETVSLADLMEGAHRRADLARLAADEIESISRIAACLHAEFAAVRPAIRLDWAERVSQFDAPVGLRNLAGLARWNEIGYIDRRQMQAYVDWLFDRIDPDLPEAAGLMNDLVRVCLLLASHAPVGQIVAGRVAKPQKATPGARITLRPFDLPRVKIGMQALLYSGTQIVARAVVDDLGDAEVSAQVVHAEGGSVQLAESMSVHFAERAALGMTLAQPMLRLGRK